MKTLNIIGKVILIRMDTDFTHRSPKRIFAGKLVVQVLNLFINEGIAKETKEYTYIFDSYSAFNAIVALDEH